MRAEYKADILYDIINLIRKSISTDIPILSRELEIKISQLKSHCQKIYWRIYYKRWER